MTARGPHAAPPAAAPDPMLPALFRVAARRRETPDTFTLDLTPGEGGDPDAVRFAPGQFNMLYVFGTGEVAISISGDPARSGRTTHTTREVGSVTRALGRLRRGDAVGVRGPFGSAWPLDEAAGRDVVVVAGGIGLAPLRPALLAILGDRRRFGRVTLLYGTRSPADILFRRDLERWGGRFDADVHVTVDRGTEAWRGDVGLVTRLLPRAAFEPAETAAFLCGPEVMMRLAAQELARRGLAAERIFLSLERNMKCAVGFCGHCQFGPEFVCRDGPVFSYRRLGALLWAREV